jgi:hypothetical protein
MMRKKDEFNECISALLTSNKYHSKGELKTSNIILSRDENIKSSAKINITKQGTDGGKQQ